MSTQKYDVFIRCGAEDPSKDFADLLYNGFMQKRIPVYIYAGEWSGDTGDNHLLELYEESMISIELIHPECDSLPDVLSTGVDLLKPYHDEFLLIFYLFSPGVREKYETGCFRKALDINKAAYGAKVHEWKKALSRVSYSDGCNIIDMTKGYRSFIDEIIKRFSKMIYEESPGKNLVETERLKMPERKYDVLISFEAEDSSKDFAHRLYKGFKKKGIRAYRYDRELNRYIEDNDSRVAEMESMISVDLIHLECASLPDVFSRGVDLLKPYHDKFLLIFYDFSFRMRKKYETGCFGEALDINEAAYGAEVHEWKEAVSMESYFDGCNIIDMTKEYRSSIDEIIKQFSKMIYMASPGRKGFQLISFLERRLSIFWDMKSSPFPTSVNPEDIAKKIKAFVKRETKINWEAVDVYAYGHSSAQQNAKLHNSGVTLIYTPGGRKDTTYIALLVDMFKRSHSCPPPSAIMLITGKISYANTLHALGLLGHKIILVTSSEVGVSVPLINASVYTWSNVAKGPTSSSQVQIKELRDDNNNWPGFHLVKREDLVATSSSQFQELSMRCKQFESIPPFDTFLFIVWDIENCPIPRGVPAKDVFMNILNFVKGKIHRSCARMRAYADLSPIPEEEESSVRKKKEVRESLEESGVQLIHTPHVKKDAADEAMMIDLFMYSKLVPSPSSIMVITGDVDFATTLHAIGGFGHDIYLVIPSRPRIDVSKSLTSASKDYWYWSEVAYGIDLTGLKGQLEELLKSNGGQLSLGSLDAEYEKMFNKPLCLSEYKADNLVNLLERMSYMISVEVSDGVSDGEALVKLKG